MSGWRKLGVLLVVMAAIWGLYQKMRPQVYTNYPPSATGPWVAFGDSLTAGYGAEAHHDYPSVLSEALGEPIRNLGISGDTTGQALDRLPQALALKPRVVLLCLGGNDGLRGVPSDQTFANLEQMIDAFQAQGSFVVLMAVPSASLRDKYHGFYKKLAREKNALFVSNILEGILGHADRLSDSIHPNDAGYAFIASRLEGVLLPFLPQLRLD